MEPTKCIVMQYVRIADATARLLGPEWKGIAFGQSVMGQAFDLIVISRQEYELTIRYGGLRKQQCDDWIETRLRCRLRDKTSSQLIWI